MSKTYQKLPFFSDEIQIRPHTATDAAYLDRWVSIRQFAHGAPVSLSYCEETAEFLVESGRRGIDYRFIEG